MNYAKTFGLMAVLTAMFVAIAGVLGGRSMMLPAFALAALFNVGSFWFSDRIVLKMYRAQKVTPEQATQLYEMVDRLRQKADLPMPVVAIAPSDQPNAFATGRSPEKSVVCVTNGILRVLDAPELEGVIAHELAHIKNRDMLTGTMAATLSGAIVFLARMGFWFGGRDERGGIVGGLLMLILAPLAAMLVQMAISRTAEFRADRLGAEISENPLGLARALQALERGAKAVPMNVNPSAAHLCIVNPLTAGGFTKLFRTHPPTAERVARLEAMDRA